ncbi:hypothetical protein RJ639_034403 [Escallonia herrerae]|uniref:DUF1664 domain-containing protein n=1 Tax=Escallonia herrerae TaxID=1293975 RepID=A0AA88WY61_9ASTE|nr:hypothetical protein RJ639_034403 [Escallonia herrerae]
MALPLGKLTILVGAGLIGSALAKEGGMSGVSDFVSGAFKIVVKQIRHNDTASTPSSGKSRTDSVLLAQVNGLREELQLLASRPVTIITSSGSGGSRYGVVIVVIVVGYGYVWWKGWRLPDMMFATRRSLSDACSTVSKQLEKATRKHLSSRIDRVDCSIDECAELTAATSGEVSELRGEIKVVGVDVRAVHQTVQNLETKIKRIDGKQNMTSDGVKKLLKAVMSMENSRAPEQIEASPSHFLRPALELPQMTPSSRTGSLPPISIVELPSSPPASNESHKDKRPLETAASTSGLKDLYGISDVVETTDSPRVSNGGPVTEETGNGNLSSSLFGRKLPGLFTRTRSAIQSFK